MGLQLVGYARVSTKGQIDAYGLDTQWTDMDSFAERFGFTIAVRREDGAKTGTLPLDQRPGLMSVLDDIKSGRVAGVLCGRLDRLARELTLQEAALKYVWDDGGRCWTADVGEWLRDDPDDPMRTAMRQMAGVFAQLDRAMITKRLRDGMKAKRAAGKHATGDYAYGWQGAGKGRERDAAPLDSEQQGVDLIRSMRADGATLRSIADALHDAGIKPRRADRWAPQTIANIANRVV